MYNFSSVYFYKTSQRKEIIIVGLKNVDNAKRFSQKLAEELIFSYVKMIKRRVATREEQKLSQLYFHFIWEN